MIGTFIDHSLCFIFHTQFLCFLHYYSQPDKHSYYCSSLQQREQGLDKLILTCSPELEDKPLESILDVSRPNNAWEVVYRAYKLPLPK